MNSKIAPNITEYIRTRVKTPDEYFTEHIDKRLKRANKALKTAERAMRHMKWFMSGDRYKNIVERGKR